MFFFVECKNQISKWNVKTSGLYQAGQYKTNPDGGRRHDNS